MLFSMYESVFGPKVARSMSGWKKHAETPILIMAAKDTLHQLDPAKRNNRQKAGKVSISAPPVRWLTLSSR